VPRALAGAAEKHGVELRYGDPVARVELRGDRAVAVHTAAGERIACDAVVLNPDLPAARRLIGKPVTRRLRYSPSCVLLLAGSSTAYADAAHHTISFGHAWRTVFDELLGGRLMSDPSFLVSTPTVSDPSLAPAGRSSYYVLFPTPNLDAGIDWREAGPRYRDQMVATMEDRGWPGFADGIEVEHLTTPQDWADRGLERGTPFAAAHTFGQTGPFRPRNLWGENVVFAGSGTVPGVGVPMVLVSGRLAAERILGPDPSYRSRTWL
jgi:phytoene desaturase